MKQCTYKTFFSLCIIFLLNYVSTIHSFSFNVKNRKIVTATTQKRLLNHVYSIDKQPNHDQETIDRLRLKNNKISCGAISNKLKIVLPTLIFSLVMIQNPSMALATNPIISSLLPSESNKLPLIFLTCTLPPTVLGFFKNEYIVSYGYGLAIFFTSLVNLITIKQAPSTIQLYHTLALMFYGIRLSLFLLYREVTIPRFREFTENIESRASPNKLKRLPFMISCAILYMCMSAPLFSGTVVTTSTAMKFILQGLVGVTWFGFLINAIGDFTKSYVKYKKKNQDELVTSGIFQYFRHPNYTGEQIAWTANFGLSIATTIANTGFDTWFSTLKAVLMNKIVWASFFGWIGIEFVLTSATKALETRQKTRYGKTEEYQAWVKKSWAGFC